MTDFEKVSDDLRNVRKWQGKTLSPRILALVDGDTLFIPLNGQTASQVGNAMRGGLLRQGYLLRVRRHEKDGIPGLIAWAERKGDLR